MAQRGASMAISSFAPSVRSENIPKSMRLTEHSDVAPGGERDVTHEAGQATALLQDHRTVAVGHLDQPGKGDGIHRARLVEPDRRTEVLPLHIGRVCQGERRPDRAVGAREVVAQPQHHVVGGRVDPAARRDVVGIDAGRRLGAGNPVAGHHARTLLRARRQGRVRHAERAGDPLAQQIGAGPARGLGQRSPEQVEAHVRVGDRAARRPWQLLVRQPIEPVGRGRPGERRRARRGRQLARQRRRWVARSSRVIGRPPTSGTRAPAGA
jgi:hypothetical protein